MLYYAVPMDVRKNWLMVMLQCAQCVLHYAVPMDVRKKLADVDATVCSMCVALCRTYGCKKNLAGGDATLCSDCRLKRDLAKLIIIPNEGLIIDPNKNNVFFCGRGIRIDDQVGNVQFRIIIHSKKS